MIPDRSQRIRHLTQAVFLLLNAWIGVQFYLFVRYFERGGWKVSRPPGVEGWLPIAGMMNTSYFLRTGAIPKIHPAAMVLFLAFLGLSIAFRKSFCGWLCPIGAISEQLWKIGREFCGKVWLPPRWLDLPLRGLKYLLLGLFVWAVGSMSAIGVESFLNQPYGLIADVKMLDFFRHPAPAAALIIGILTIASLFVPNLWCRFLCPYGALMGLASLVSPFRIRRVRELCIDCGKCAKACPSGLPVDRLIQLRSAECIACLECIADCPAQGALVFSTLKRVIHPYVMAAAIVAGFLAAVGLASLTGHWHSPIPDSVYQHLIPQAADLTHP